MSDYVRIDCPREGCTHKFQVANGGFSPRGLTLFKKHLHEIHGGYTDDDLARVQEALSASAETAQASMPTGDGTGAPEASNGEMPSPEQVVQERKRRKKKDEASQRFDEFCKLGTKRILKGLSEEEEQQFEAARGEMLLMALGFQLDLPEDGGIQVGRWMLILGLLVSYVLPNSAVEKLRSGLQKKMDERKQEKEKSAEETIQ